MFGKYIKMILLAAILTVIAANVEAQSAVKLPLAIGDTILNTTTVSKVFSATGGYQGANVQVVLISQTGTAAGSAKLYGSNDGTNYDLVPSTASDTLAITTTALHYTWRVAGPLPQYLKVKAVGTGTQHTLVKVYYKFPLYQGH